MCLDDSLGCPVCWHDFNDTENTPYVLWCGHSLCKSCVFGMDTAMFRIPFLTIPIIPVHMPLFIACPWCQFLSPRMSWKGTLKWPRKNFFLLWIVESHRRACQSQQPSLDSSSPSEAVSPVAGAVSPPTSDLDALLFRQHERRRDTDLNLVQTRNSLQAIIRGLWDINQWSLLLARGAGVALQLALKLPLILLFLFIVVYVLPFSTLILALYILLTILLALPSLLVVYLSYPSLEWLAREIAIF